MASQQKPSVSKRPRLSLQTQPSCIPPTAKTLRGYPVDAGDATAFNTLSNAYMAAVERSSSPCLSWQPEPMTAINTLQAFSLATPAGFQGAGPRAVTPCVASHPETPSTGHSTSPPHMEFDDPSTATATPPLSSGTTDSDSSKVFTFSSSDISYNRSRPQSCGGPAGAWTPRRRAAPGPVPELPYTHTRRLHSILRNSPLPTRTATPPPSPRRQSLRLQEKAAKRVGYNSPLTQEIITTKYIKSHIELLAEDASPNSPPLPAEPGNALSGALAFTANEVMDGGQTPGPPEGACRIVTGLGPEPPSPEETCGTRKRRRTEKNRRLVWTIGQDDDDNDDDVDDAGGAIYAPRAEAAMAPPLGNASSHAAGGPVRAHVETPAPNMERAASAARSEDHHPELCESSRTDADLETPTAPRRPGLGKRDTPISAGAAGAGLGCTAGWERRAVLSGGINIDEDQNGDDGIP